MSDCLTRQLADIVARPPDDHTRRRAALHVLDWIGCAVVGATSAAGRVLAAYGRRQPAGPCTTLGAGSRDVAAAAFVNGGLGNIFEMDDLHRMSIVHPGDVVVPAALAAAERDHADGRSFLDAVVRGYEVATRIGTAAGPEHYRYWYSTATCGVFGAATAVASLHRLDRHRLVDALGQAGSQAAGPWQCRIEPTHTKQLNTARAAQSGLIAADLAALGFKGPARILEGSHGFFAAMAPNARAAMTTADPGAPWAIYDTSFKPWPACRHAHPAVEAALALRGSVDPAAIARIDVSTYVDAVDFCNRPEPRTANDARFSVQYCVAVTVLRGAPALANFAEPALADTETRTLAAKVAVRDDPIHTLAFPGRYGATLDITLNDGTRLSRSVETAKGDPENPMADAEIEDKARTLMAAGGMAALDIDATVAACRALPEAETATAICTYLTAVPTPVTR